MFRFCKLILQGRSPTVRAGDTRSFSLLFAFSFLMHRLALFMQHSHEGWDSVEKVVAASDLNEELSRRGARCTIPQIP